MYGCIYNKKVFANKKREEWEEIGGGGEGRLRRRVEEEREEGGERRGGVRRKSRSGEEDKRRRREEWRKEKRTRTRRDSVRGGQTNKQLLKQLVVISGPGWPTINLTPEHVTIQTAMSCQCTPFFTNAKYPAHMQRFHVQGCHHKTRSVSLWEVYCIENGTFCPPQTNLTLLHWTMDSSLAKIWWLSAYHTFQFLDDSIHPLSRAFHPTSESLLGSCWRKKHRKTKIITSLSFSVYYTFPLMKTYTYIHSVPQRRNISVCLSRQLD